MQARGWTCHWLGTATGMEHGLVPPAGIPIDALDFTGLRGKGLKHTLTGGIRAAARAWPSRAHRAPRAAPTRCSAGRLLCFPGGMWPRLLGVPLVLVNADAALLLSNKRVAAARRQGAFGFDGAAAARRSGAVVTGNPVRAEIAALPRAGGALRRAQRAAALLVVGGSLGREGAQRNVPAALALIPPSERPRSCTRAAQRTSMRCARPMPRRASTAEVQPFIDDMAGALRRSATWSSAAPARSPSANCAPPACRRARAVRSSHHPHQRDNAACSWRSTARRSTCRRTN